MDWKIYRIHNPGQKVGELVAKFRYRADAIRFLIQNVHPHQPMVLKYSTWTLFNTKKDEIKSLTGVVNKSEFVYVSEIVVARHNAKLEDARIKYESRKDGQKGN